MVGQIRYARRTGANFAVLNPDNQFKLTADAQVAQEILTVDKILPWIEAGALVTLNQTEMLEVQTWDPVALKIFINTPLSATWPIGSLVTLWATPLVMHFDAALGANQIYVRSRYQIVNGDKITTPTASSLNSLQQINVVTSTAYGTDPSDVDFPYIFILDLASPIPVPLDQGTGAIYLRSYPSYVSQVLSVPSLSSGQIGPFLLDFVASPLDSVTSYPETFSVRTIASGNTMVDGGSNYFKTVSRNYPVVNRPIYAENMIFWEMIRGYGGFILPNKFRMVANSLLPNSEYAARTFTRMVPPIEAGIRYDFTVSADTAGTFIAIPYPYPPVEVSIPVTTPTTVTIETPDGGEPITRLDFIFRSARENTEVTISNASLPVDPVVQQFQYSYVFEVLGTTNFQATSIILKPYFLSLSDLTDSYDNGKTYNSGFIYL